MTLFRYILLLIIVCVALGGCADKKDTETLTDILTIPFRIIGI